MRCITRLRPDEVASWPEVLSAQWDGPYLEALASDAEALVRKLLDRDGGLSGLEVVPASLEEAFLTLTDDSQRSLEGAA